MNKLILSILLLLCLPAQAVVRDFCKCDAGAQGGCVATTPNAPTLAEINVRAVGDVDRYCEGGSWLNPTHWQAVYNTVATGTRPFATPITLVSKYTAGWGGGGVKPLFTRNIAGHMMNFGDFGSAWSDGGYIIRDAKFVGRNVSDGGSSQGINLGNDGTTNNTVGTQRVLIEGMDISAFDGALSTAAGGLYRRITIRGNNFHHNTETGTLAGEFEDVLFENNDVSYNNPCPVEAGCGFEHGLYWSHVTRGVIRNNRFVDNSKINGTGDCAGGNITMHGLNHDVTFENNLVHQSGGTLGGCYGFSITPAYSGQNEVWDRLVIRRNTVINVGVGYHINSAPSAVIENNTFINTTAFGSTCITYGSFVKEAGDVSDTAGIFRNNVCYFTASVGGTGVDSSADRTPTNVVVANNIVWFGAGTSGTRSCFDHNALGTYAAHNNNICYGASRYSATYANHAAAEAAGFDTWTTTLDDDDPLFAATPNSGNNWNLNIQTGSPAKNTGSNTYCARLTKTGRVRTGVCNIGAYQFGLDP